MTPICIQARHGEQLNPASDAELSVEWCRTREMTGTRSEISLNSDSPFAPHTVHDIAMDSVARAVDHHPPEVAPVRVLVVEDEAKVARALQEGLEAEHYHVAVSTTGEDAFYRVSTEAFDVIVLDVMLPGRNGFEIVTSLRERQIQTPVLLLTARDAVEDRVRGLESGADDYLVKPFAFAELLARIRAVLRRGRMDQVLRLRAADLDLDLVSRRALRGEIELALTVREFELLEYLLRHKGQLVSREMLARDVWHEPQRAATLDNVMDVYMARLRKKVDQEFQLKLIHTVRGVGFTLRESLP
jgi:DNA-binding response OmpR family regulator